MTINFAEERSGGVYSDRMLQNNRKNHVMPPNTEEELKASKEAKEKLKRVDVTFSPESIEFMSGVAARKETAHAERERIQQEIDEQLNGLNPFEFTGNADTRFTVFTRKLVELGFYDGKSDEAQAKIYEYHGSQRLYPPSEKEKMSHLSGKVQNTEACWSKLPDKE